MNVFDIYIHMYMYVCLYIYISTCTYIYSNPPVIPHVGFDGKFTVFPDVLVSSKFDTSSMC